MSRDKLARDIGISIHTHTHCIHSYSVDGLIRILATPSRLHKTATSKLQLERSASCETRKKLKLYYCALWSLLDYLVSFLGSESRHPHILLHLLPCFGVVLRRTCAVASSARPYDNENENLCRVWRIVWLRVYTLKMKKLRIVCVCMCVCGSVLVRSMWCELRLQCRCHR